MRCGADSDSTSNSESNPAVVDGSSDAGNAGDAQDARSAGTRLLFECDDDDCTRFGDEGLLFAPNARFYYVQWKAFSPGSVLKLSFQEGGNAPEFDPVIQDEGAYSRASLDSNTFEIPLDSHACYKSYTITLIPRSSGSGFNYVRSDFVPVDGGVDENNSTCSQFTSYCTAVDDQPENQCEYLEFEGEIELSEQLKAPN